MVSLPAKSAIVRESFGCGDKLAPKDSYFDTASPVSTNLAHRGADQAVAVFVKLTELAHLGHVHVGVAIVPGLARGKRYSIFEYSHLKTAKPGSLNISRSLYPLANHR